MNVSRSINSIDPPNLDTGPPRPGEKTSSSGCCPTPAASASGSAHTRRHAQPAPAFTPRHRPRPPSCPKMKMFPAPTWSRISTLAPSSVPIVSAPFNASFMFPVPDASIPAVADLLAQIRRRDDLFRQAHIVVRQENHLQPTRNRRILVDHLPHIMRQPDNQLRHPIPRRRLPREQLHPRHPVPHRLRPDRIVQRHRMQHVQQLPLVYSCIRLICTSNSAAAIHDNPRPLHDHRRVSASLARRRCAANSAWKPAILRMPRQIRQRPGIEQTPAAPACPSAAASAPDWLGATTSEP